MEIKKSAETGGRGPLREKGVLATRSAGEPKRGFGRVGKTRSAMESRQREARLGRRVRSSLRRGMGPTWRFSCSISKVE